MKKFSLSQRYKYEQVRRVLDSARECLLLIENKQDQSSLQQKDVLCRLISLCESEPSKFILNCHEINTLLPRSVQDQISLLFATFSADLGSGDSRYLLAERARISGEREKATHYYYLALESYLEQNTGTPSAIVAYRIAHMYDDGLVPAESPEEMAITWCLKCKEISGKFEINKQDEHHENSRARANVFEKLASIYIRQKKYDKALAELVELKTFSWKKSEAAYQLGMLYSSDECIPQDISLAITYLEEAIASPEGYPEAKLLRAKLYTLEKNYQQALIYYNELITSDLKRLKHLKNFDRTKFKILKAEAKYRLACFYDFGWGVPANHDQAFNFYQSAANDGDHNALFWMGMFYKHQRQDGRVEQYFKKILLLSDQLSSWSKANYQLGRIYEKAKGVKENLNQAIDYYQSAIEHDNPDACFRLAQLYALGRVEKKKPKEIFSLYQKAWRLYNKILEVKEHPDLVQAHFKLGWMLQYGLGQKINFQQALKHYQKAIQIKSLPRVEKQIKLIKGEGAKQEEDSTQSQNNAQQQQISPPEQQNLVVPAQMVDEKSIPSESDIKIIVPMTIPNVKKNKDIKKRRKKKKNTKKKLMDHEPYVIDEPYIADGLDLVPEDTLKFHAQLPLDHETKFVFDQLKQVGESYVVGGTTRDGLLGKNPHDGDIATLLIPNKILEIFRSYRECYAEYNPMSRFPVVYLKFSNGKIVEVTTFRADPVKAVRNDHGVIIRHTECGTFATDFKSRDFTINALYYNPDKGEVIDPTKRGMSDLKNKILCLIDDANTSIIDDPLRILRGIRFEMECQLHLEPATLQAIKMHGSAIVDIHPTRFYQELVSKILQSPQVDKIMMRLYELDLLRFIFPIVSDYLSSHCTKRLIYKNLLSVLADKNAKEKDPSVTDDFLWAILLWGPLQSLLIDNQSDRTLAIYMVINDLQKTVVLDASIYHGIKRVLSLLVAPIDAELDSQVHRKLRSLRKMINEAKARTLYTQSQSVGLLGQFAVKVVDKNIKNPTKIEERYENI